MQAKETPLKNMLEGKRQFVIPLYQRRYAWKNNDWENFWVAVKRQYSLVARAGEHLSRPTHFLGSLVVKPMSDQSSGLSVYHVIDGQQRLTTATVLLIAIRDLWESEEDKERVGETYLINKWEKGSGRLKLFPGTHDRADLKALVDGSPKDATGAIGEAYRWFKNEISVLANEVEGTLDFDALERTLIGRLEVVDVTLGPEDNAHRIFQTLNSTGRGLSQVDLLRNHFFMLLPSFAEEAYEQYWQPMEERLGSWMDYFLWVETVSRGEGRESVPRDRVYLRWQSDLSHVEDDESQVLETVKELSEKSLVYRRIIEPEYEGEVAVRRRLERLRSWGSNVYHPLALQAMMMLEGSPDELEKSLLYVESFMVRRLIAGIPTNNLNRIFTTTAGQLIGAKSYGLELHEKLSARGKHWPTDEELRVAARVEPFYRAQRATQRQFVLRRLEESLPGKEVPDWEATSYTIEHVMPQHATEEWLTVLRGSDSSVDPMAEHAALVDTLGNLTLTSQNSELSDHPFERKRDILSNSILKMNKRIQDAAVWNRQAIEQRSNELADVAVSVWPGPVDFPTEASESWREDLIGTLEFMPDGSWVAIEDLAELVERSAEDVRSFLVEYAPKGKEHVLRMDGRVDTSLPWVRQDVAAFRGLLVARGVIDDTTTEVANSSQRLAVDAIAGLQGGPV